MKRILPKLEYIIYIIWINIITFVLRPMNWTVFCFDSEEKIVNLLIKTISNLFLFLITLFVIAWFFKSQSKVVTYRELFRLFFKRILIFGIAIRFSADSIELFLKTNSNVVTETLVTLIETIVLFLIFYFIKKQITPEKIIKTKKYIVFLELLSISMIIMLHTFYFIYAQNVKNNILQKFSDTSSFSYAQSFEFELQCINLLFSIVLWVVLFVHFGLFDFHSKEYYRMSVMVAKMLLLFVVTPIFIAVKIVVFPTGTMRYISGNSLDTITYTNEKNICYNYNTFELTRADINIQKSVYKNTTVSFKYLNNDILKFTRKSNMNLGEFHKDDFWFGITFYRYDFDAMAYINEQGKFNALVMQDINSYSKKDDNIIVYMEYLIKQGYFEAFEYSYKYLSKYDSEFIRPYIDDTIKTTEYFCDNSNNDYINDMYIINFLKYIE